MKNIFIIATIFSIVLIACKKDKTEVDCETPNRTMQVYLQPTLNDSAYAINQIIESPQGYRYYYTDIKIVGTNVGNGSAQLKDAFLYDFSETGILLTSNQGLKSDYTDLKFNLGVPDPLNTSDPSLQSSTSPLNITNIGDMHWGWNPGYKFVTIEGKVDTIADGIDNFDKSFFFHLGTDFLFRTKTISAVDWVDIDANTSRTTLKLDVKAILDGPNPTDLRVYAASHSNNTQMFYSVIIMDAFAAGIKK
ncbi:MAG: hypothetical protein P8M61_10485 [Crocinitomicaceae bacterium]|jgi:hypothetical protein|nr:hypothetical protein [Crocinitomicaceae bacterium]